MTEQTHPKVVQALRNNLGGVVKERFLQEMMFLSIVRAYCCETFPNSRQVPAQTVWQVMTPHLDNYSASSIFKELTDKFTTQGICTKGEIVSTDGGEIEKISMLALTPKGESFLAQREQLLRILLSP